MDFAQIRYFLALADCLNFTRAAEHCHVTQPTLTQAIQRLEDELGGQLIRRDGRNTRLTELGKVLRGYFEQIDETKRALKATASAVGAGLYEELNIGLMCTIGPQILSLFLDVFQTGNPNVVLMLHDVTPGVIPRLLLSGAIDGAFCARHGTKDDRLCYEGLFCERMVVAFPDGHEFAKLSAVPLSMIAGERYLDRLHCEFRDDLLTFVRERNIEIDVAFASQREDWIQKMVRDGAGISVVPEYSLLPPVLDHRPISDPTLDREVEFATLRQGERKPALSGLISQLKDYAWDAEA